MRLYVHMIACGSICTLLYIFFNSVLPWELPLTWRKAFLRINTLLYLLPVPWFATQVKGEIRLLLVKAGMTFTDNDRSKYIDTVNIWKSIYVVDEDGKLLYMTGYRNWLAVIAGGCLIFLALAVGRLVVYLAICRQYKKMAEFPGERYVRAGKKKVRIGTSVCVDSPLTVGIIKPVVLFPDGALDGLPEGELNGILSRDGEKGRLACILSHEVSHVSGRDILGKYFAFLAIATEWFNPLTYYLFKESGEVSEMLCDMAAVEGRTKKEQAEYIECIIEAAQKSRGSGIAEVSLAASKTLTEKRMERLMGKNVKRIWKKGIAAVIMAVCFTVSCVPAFAYEEPLKYEVAEEADKTAEKWNTVDRMTFIDEEEEKEEYTDFGLGDSVFVDEDGMVWETGSFRAERIGQERVSCQHSFKSGTIVEHSKKSDGSCTETSYNAKRCTICGYIVKGSRISTLTYDKCPH